MDEKGNGKGRVSGIKGWRGVVKDSGEIEGTEMEEKEGRMRKESKGGIRGRDKEGWREHRGSEGRTCVHVV